MTHTVRRPLRDWAQPGLAANWHSLRTVISLRSLTRLPQQSLWELAVDSRFRLTLLAVCFFHIALYLAWYNMALQAGVLISHLQHNDMRVLAFAGFVNRLTGLFSGLGQFLLFINLPLLLMGRSPISWLAILLMIAAPTLSGLLHLALAGTREFEADLGAVKLTGDPFGLASALRKLDQSQASWLRMLVPGYRLPESAVLRTHPNTKERIERLLALTDIPMPLPGPERTVTLPAADSQRWPSWYFTALF